MAKVFTTASLAAVPRTSVALRAVPREADWRAGLPTLASHDVTLREPVASDALALLTALSEGALHEIMPDPPPATVLGLGVLIERLQADRRAGTMRCWAIVTRDTGLPVGLVGLRSLDASGAMVEGVGAIADEFQGTATFQVAARLVLGCFFGPMKGHRIEFRVDVRNGRANGALRKLGAAQEGVLRRAHRLGDTFHDQVLWALVASDWSESTRERSPGIH
jgi:N-acetyltransferase